MSTPKRYALVTGCSEGGMGWYVAREFAQRGVHTFATLRTPSKAGNLASTPNLEILTLDVSSSESISACVKAVAEKTGGRLDYLYNNAGAMYMMPVADIDIPEAKKTFDINFWGVLETTQKFLPLLVAAKGHVSTAASVRSDLLQEYDSIYGATKAAVTMLVENMRIEFEPLGVSVSCVHVGSVATEIFANGPTAKHVPLPENSYYLPISAQVQDIASGAKARQVTLMQPSVFAKKVVSDLLGGKTGALWRGGYASLTRYLRWLPQWALDMLTLSSISGLPALKTHRQQMAKKAQ